MFTGIDMDGSGSENKPKVTEMVAPVYAAGETEQLAINHFKEVVVHAEAIRLMQGPVYDVDR